MKGIIKKTGEVVDLTTSKNLSGETVLVKINTGLVLSLDEVELMPEQKMVSLDEVCEWVNKYVDCYAYNKDFVKKEDFIKSLRKEFES